MKSRVLVCAVVCVLGVGGTLTAAAGVDRPNIVLFVADDMGWNDAGYHGSEIRTPNIDRLVTEGVELDRFYAYPVCTPTRAALFTGRIPLRMGITGPIGGHADGVPLDEHFMSETFKAAGYQTFAVGKWHLGGSGADYFATSRGFDHFYGHLAASTDYFTHRNEAGQLDWQRNGQSVEEEGYTTHLIAAEAIRLLKGRDKTKPVFLYVPFNAVHTPLQAPEEAIAKYADIEDSSRRTYAAMAEVMDTAIGDVLATVDEQGMRDDTLVMFFSDNGGAPAGASNDPLRGGKGGVFEGGIRLLAVLRWPGVLKPGSKLDQPICVYDLFPTFSAAAGIKPGNTKPLDGRNMWEAIRDLKSVPRNDILIGSRGGYAVLRGPWKMVRLRLTEDGAEESYLFRIIEDPYEEENLAEEHPEIVRQLVAKSTDVTRILVGTTPGPRRAGGEGRSAGASARQRGLAQYDTDGDSVVLKADVPEERQAAFDAGDTNQDGKIDADEFNAIRARRRAAGLSGGAAGRPAGPGARRGPRNAQGEGGTVGGNRRAGRQPVED